MHFLTKMWYYLTGKIYLEANTLQKTGTRILHISDTPSQFYPELGRLIKRLKPDYIIHTGDLVDNIKLEQSTVALARYHREVKALKNILCTPGLLGVYIALGNHDDSPYVHILFEMFSVTDTYATVEISGLKLAFSHYVDQLTNLDADLYLYGHNIDQEKRSTHYLNGLTAIHVIDLNPYQVHRIPYPLGVDDARLYRSHFGI